MSESDYVIVGGGMAADAAARSIREHDPHGSITILSADVDGPYARPALSKKLWTDPSFTWDQVPLGTASATGAELRLETVVTAIDRTAKTVRLADGTDVGYGRLLLVPGARPNRIDAPEDPRIRFYRSAADYRFVRDAVHEGLRVVVLGGGYIGSELAAALVQHGAEVTLVHPDEMLGAAQFPPDLAARYEARFESAGVRLVPGRRGVAATVEPDGVALALDDGGTVVGDLLLVGLGVSPVVDLAADAGMEIDDGIVVDAYLRTADEHIWVAGDVARYPDALLGESRVEHVDHAQQSGAAVGAPMAGRPTRYEHTPMFYSEVFGVRWEAVGRIDGALETVEDWLEPGETVVVYYLVGRTVVGVLLWNLAGRTDAARAVLAEGEHDRDELIGRIRVD